jgi:branched-chain amino acid transport system permease protein
MRSTAGYAIFLALFGAVWAIHTFAIPWTDTYTTSILIRAGINMIAVLGLSLVLGFTGQFSLGHAGFMAVGGYTAAWLNQQGLPPVPATLAGGLTAAFAGLAVGLPSLRLSGDYLAIVTLGFNAIIIGLIQNTKTLGAALGLIGLPQATDFGTTFSWLLIGIFFFKNLLNSAWGRNFMAVRDNEIAVRSLGINTTQVKVTAFVLGAAWAGIAGGLLAFLNASISPGQFDLNRSIELVAMVVLGGTGSLSGPLIAAAILTALPEFLRPIAEYRLVLYSLILVLMMILRPQGLLGSREIGDLFRR